MTDKGTKRDWIAGFLFVGNQLLLDFLNTRPLQDGEPEELLTDLAAVLRWFVATELLSSQMAARLGKKRTGKPEAARFVERLREFRERLRADVLEWEHGAAVRASTIAELNRLLAEHPMRKRLKSDGKSCETESWFACNELEDLYAPLAGSALALFSEIDRKRVRKCGQCVLHFRDTSKKGTRRWCSMQLCGNRLKVAAYAARQRASASR